MSLSKLFDDQLRLDGGGTLREAGVAHVSALTTWCYAFATRYGVVGDDGAFANYLRRGMELMWIEAGRPADLTVWLRDGCDEMRLHMDVLYMYAGLFGRLLKWMCRRDGGLDRTTFAWATGMFEGAALMRFHLDVDKIVRIIPEGLRLNDNKSLFECILDGTAMVIYVDPWFEETLGDGTVVRDAMVAYAANEGCSAFSDDELNSVRAGYQARVALLVQGYGGLRFNAEAKVDDLIF